MSARRRSGFTLVEILFAVSVGALLSAVVLQAVSHFLFLEKRILQNALAWERGHNVLSILEPRVLHAGLGVTYGRSGNVFSRSFGGDSAGAPPPARWTQGPLQIWEGHPSFLSLASEVGGVYRGRGISVLYAVPSALKARPKRDGRGSFDMSAGDSVTVQLVPSGNLGAIAERLPTRTRNDLRAWVTFPLMRLPVYASAYGGGNLTIRLAEGSGLSATLRSYDEMHYLRAQRFQVRNERLYSEELTSSWGSAEERLEGVLEMWFEWTPSKRLLEAWVLTTGGVEGAEREPGGRPEDWPAEAPWSDEFERRSVAVTRGSWLLQNL